MDEETTTTEQTQAPQKTADQLAAETAEAMFGKGRPPGHSQPITANHQRTAPDPMEKGGGAGGMPTTTAAATGGFTATAGGKVLDKGEEGKDDEEEKEDENDMEKKGETCKSEEEAVDADNLLKAMDALDAAADGMEEPEVDRRAELAKGLEQGTLTDDERQELLTLLGADQPQPAGDAINKSDPEGETTEEVDEDLDKGFEQLYADQFQEDYDVSPFLEKLGTTVGASMDILREDLAKSAGQQQLFNKALAKSFRGIASVISSQQEMVKSLSAQNEALAQRLGIVEQQPVGRKSIDRPGQAQPLEKSFADSPAGTELNRAQIFDGLHRLMVKYKDTGGRAANGEPIDRAVSSFELTGQISKSMLAEVKGALSG